MTAKRVIVNVPTERDKKLNEYEALRSVLSQLELEFANLQMELRAFELRYLQHVGYLLAELDEIEAKISELLFKLAPNDPQYKQKAKEDRQKAEQTFREAKFAEEQPPEKTQYQASDDLKSLYREVAKKVHPDLAENEADRAIRSEWMKQANQAFAEQDLGKLKEILMDAALSGIGERSADDEKLKIERLNQKIEALKVKIEKLRGEIQRMLASDIHQLMQNVISAELFGRNLLDEIANDLLAQIAQRKARLEELIIIHERKQTC